MSIDKSFRNAINSVDSIILWWIVSVNSGFEFGSH